MKDQADDLETRLRQRLEALRREQAGGEAQLAQLQARADELRTTLLRISGAIQVIEETLHGQPDGEG